MELNLVWLIAQRELREALRNKWLAAYAIGFALLALALSRASLAAAGYAGLGGFGRTAASLINALLLFVPLLGLSVGASALAADRERGTLFYLLAQPVSKAEVFWGKALGTTLGMTASLAGGFGLAALGLSTGVSGDPLAFLGLAGFTLLLALASLGIGFLVSALTRKGATAIGAALLIWLGLAFLGDLGLIVGVLALRPDPATLLGLLVANPLQIFKLGAVYTVHATLDPLGAAGQYAMYRFGNALPIGLAGLLLAWCTLTFGAAYAWFNRRKDL